MLKAVLIDPKAQTLTDVEWSGSYRGERGAYELLSLPDHRIHLVEAARLGGGVTLLIDEEGALVDGNAVFQFESMDGTPSPPFAGRALLVFDAPPTEDGPDFTDLPARAAAVARQIVRFPGYETTGDLSDDREMTEHELREASASAGFPVEFGIVGGGPRLRPIHDGKDTK